MKKVFLILAFLIGCSPSTKTVYVSQPVNMTTVIVSVDQSAIVCDYVWVYDSLGVRDILMAGFSDTLAVAGSWVGIRWRPICNTSREIDSFFSVRAGLMMEVR